MEKEMKSIPMPGPMPPQPPPLYPYMEKDPRIDMAITLLRTAVELLEQTVRPIPPVYGPMHKDAGEPE